MPHSAKCCWSTQQAGRDDLGLRALGFPTEQFDTGALAEVGQQVAATGRRNKRWGFD